jgi:hypothetical protein
MSHSHAHGEADGTYFLDQLFTILTCGALGVVAILMYQTGMLGRILVPMFFPWVVAGGVAVILMACVRAIAVWQLAGARRAAEAQAEADDYRQELTHSHGHDHAHSHAHGSKETRGHDHTDGAACEHEHGHSHSHSGGAAGGHDHGHSHSHAGSGEEEAHDHGWAPWRYMVLAIPVFLYFLGLPRDSVDWERTRNTGSGLQGGSLRKSVAMLAGGLAYPKTQPRTLKLGFNELAQAAAVPARHEAYEGDIGTIRGQFSPRAGSDREFSLFRMKMTCCAADAVLLETRILAPDASTLRGIQPNQWVQVEGVISFQQNEKGKWIPVITMQNPDAIDPNAESTTDVNAF